MTRHKSLLPGAGSMLLLGLLLSALLVGSAAEAERKSPDLKGLWAGTRTSSRNGETDPMSLRIDRQRGRRLRGEVEMAPWQAEVDGRLRPRRRFNLSGLISQRRRIVGIEIVGEIDSDWAPNRAVGEYEIWDRIGRETRLLDEGTFRLNRR